MGRETFYFFAELSFDLAIWNGLATIIRGLKPEARLELVYSLEKRFDNYDLNKLTNIYDKVHYIRGSSFFKNSNWKDGLTLRNIFFALYKNFPDALRTRKDLNNIDYSYNSIAFVHGGKTLNQAIFLKRVKSDKRVKSVLLTYADFYISPFLADWYINKKQSMLLNMYMYLFGPALLDVYWVKTPKNIRTNLRHFIFRQKPADFVFDPVYPIRYIKPKNDRVYLPLPQIKKAPNQSSKGTVMFVGGGYHFLGGLPKEVEGIFFRKLNKIIDLIRIKHNKQRLLFKSHPSQTEDDLKMLDLDGFEIESSTSSEVLFLYDFSLEAVYSFHSTSTKSAACLGIPSFFVYNLFDLDELCLPKTVQRHWNDRCISEVYPQMNIKSIDDWMNGKNDYIPIDLTKKIWDSTKKMIDSIIKETGSTI